MNHLIRNLIILSAAGLLTASSAGCKHDASAKADVPDNRIYGEKFLGPDEARDVFRASNAQCASGAREDAMLHACDFDKGLLNTAGQDKLDFMIEDDDSNTPMVVYLDVPQDGQYASRSESVVKYCQERSVSGEQLKVVQGTNPASYHSASQGVAALKAEAAAGVAPVASPAAETAGSTMK
jgi:hypothetical protein